MSGRTEFLCCFIAFSLSLQWGPPRRFPRNLLRPFLETAVASMRHVASREVTSRWGLQRPSMRFCMTLRSLSSVKSPGPVVHHVLSFAFIHSSVLLGLIRCWMNRPDELYYWVREINNYFSIVFIWLKCRFSIILFRHCWFSKKKRVCIIYLI